MNLILLRGIWNASARLSLIMNAVCSLLHMVRFPSPSQEATMAWGSRALWQTLWVVNLFSKTWSASAKPLSTSPHSWTECSRMLPSTSSLSGWTTGESALMASSMSKTAGRTS